MPGGGLGGWGLSPLSLKIESCFLEFTATQMPREADRHFGWCWQRRLELTGVGFGGRLRPGGVGAQTRSQPESV